MFFHHLDVHVRDLAAVKPLFDALMPVLGRPRIVSDETGVTYYPPDGNSEFFGLLVDQAHTAGSMQVAFAARDRAQVDELAHLARDNGAKEIDGPELLTEYGPTYYAFFFQDADGNRYEVVHR